MLKLEQYCKTHTEHFKICHLELLLHYTNVKMVGAKFFEFILPDGAIREMTLREKDMCITDVVFRQQNQLFFLISNIKFQISESLQVHLCGKG